MHGFTFELARLEHAKAIESMRNAASADLTAKLGPGHWGGLARIQSIRERIRAADPGALRRMTLFVATHNGGALGSIAVSTWPPGFWKRQYWRDPKATGLGVFGLTVFPEHQGKGLGKLLMEGAEQEARSHGIPYVRLDAYSVNPFSNGFYQAIGYEECGDIEVHGCALVQYEKGVL